MCAFSIIPLVAFANLNTSVFDNSTISFGMYNNWGRLSWREGNIPRPIIFNVTRQADQDFELAWTKPVYSFFDKHLDVNLGLSVNRAALRQDTMWVFSFVPELQYFVLPKSKVSPFVTWSIAGISYLNRSSFGGAPISHCLFQDYLGLGVKVKSLSIFAKLPHYSGGDVVSKVEGFDVPFTINIGYTF